MQQNFLVGLKILEKRKALRMTQVELGKQVGVSGGAISQFEKGISNPTEQTLKKLSHALNYDFELLLSGSLPADDELAQDYLSTYPGNFLEQARKKKNLSQSQLAELVGVSRASISLYETGAGDPSFRVLNKLAEVLDFSLLTLMKMSQDDYSAVMWTREGFDETNAIRSGLIKKLFNREEKYVEVDLMLPSRLASDIITSARADKVGIDVNLCIDPNRVFNGELRWPTISILELQGVDYTDAGVFVVKDNKMGARYPENSRHVLHPIKDTSEWKYLTGLHGFYIKGSSIIIRKIVSNRGDFFELSDANGNLISVAYSDVAMVWRVGQTIHMPVEE
jgi:transcriptional regulator with XRE-family HTH domain